LKTLTSWLEAQKEVMTVLYKRLQTFYLLLNLTFKLNPKMNFRVAGSQTVVRPEFREVSPLAYYDFDLGATVIGNKSIQRTKITMQMFVGNGTQETEKSFSCRFL
jgi:hypothetical protein